MPVKRRRCVLSGAEVDTLERFYREMSRQLGFPPHFGRNLDALWDALTADIPGPVEVVWKDPERSRRSMREDFERVLGILRGVERERGDFSLRFEPAPGKRKSDGRDGR